MVEPLLETLGVLEAEKSPFCRTFGSLAELKGEYVEYQPKTFVFKGARGTGTTGEEEDTGGGAPDASPELIVSERVKSFARNMLKPDEKSDHKDEDIANEKEEEHSEIAPDTAPSNHEELMKQFKGLSSSISADLMQNI